MSVNSKIQSYKMKEHEKKVQVYVDERRLTAVRESKWPRKREILKWLVERLYK